jgi:hypothetical protein
MTEVSLTYQTPLYCLQSPVLDQQCFNCVPGPCNCLHLLCDFVTLFVFCANDHLIFFDVEHRNFFLSLSNFSRSETAAW